jgi:branched-chain amino acid transport system ATP-binding protein
MRLLEVHGLTTGYRGVPVVRNVSLVVDRGEIVALLGANGAGKSTLLLTVSGLLEPQAGQILLEGTPITGARPDMIARRGLVQVPESRALFTQLTVAENIRLAAKSKAAAQVALDYFPALVPLMNRRAGVLSGGEQQMLALARAVVARPRLLLVDELSLGLAPIIVHGLLPVLRTYVEQTGGAVLFVEQHVHLALELADRAYVMSRGRIVQEGPADRIAGSMDELMGSYLGKGS